MTGTTTLLAAASAGALSFLSPCVFPLVPGYMAFLTGTAAGETRPGKWRTILSAAAFSLGFGLVFVALGASASVVGQVAGQYRRALEVGSGILILLFGLHLTGVFRLSMLMRDVRLHSLPRPRGPLGAVLVGGAFGFGWSPCIGPLLGGMLTLAAAESTLASGVTLLSAYGLGLAVPFVLAAAALDRFVLVSKRIKPYLPWFERAGGVLLTGFAVLLLTGRAGWISMLLPGFESLAL